MATRILAVITLLLITAACGAAGNGSSPTAPTPTSAITGLSITPATDLIKLKARETFSSIATFSDGTSRAVTAAWGTSAPGVATVDSSGHATGMGSGETTIFAWYQGHRATQSLRVVPDYHGLWQGDWRVTGCADEGDWVGLCREFEVGSLWGLTLAVSQNRDAITGTVDFGRLPGPMSGTIRQSGHLVLTAAYTMTIEEEIATDVTLTDWETITTGNNRMTGRFRATLQAPWCQGSLSADGELRVVIKTAAVPALAASSSTASLDRALTGILPPR